MKRYIIGLIVNNRYGVLSRISALFARRGFNINSLTVGETVETCYSRMTIVVSGTPHDRDQVVKQLAKLHDVLYVSEMKESEVVNRELVLIKVRADRSSRQEIMDAAQVFRNKIIDYTPKSITLELTGETRKIDAFIELMKEYGILELGRTGLISLQRGDSCLSDTKRTH